MAVLAIERNPWATNLPPYPILFKAAFAVWLFMCCFGSFLLGKTYSRCALIGFITSKTSRACIDKGTICSRLAFILLAGIIQSFSIGSISDHRAPEASEGRTRVNSCHSIRQRVGTDKFDIAKDRISSGSSSGLRVGIFCFFGFSNAIPTPEAGFASINPVLTA